MASAQFNKWCTRHFWTVGDGAMLLLGLEPTGEYPPTFNPRAPQLVRLYHDIIAAAQSDLGGKLPTKWIPFSPVLPATRANAAFVNVLPGDWIAWARQRKFRIPQPLGAVANRLRRTPTLQGVRQSELEALLLRIQVSAVRTGQNFDRGQMAGTKDQFKRLIKDHCHKLGSLQGATLDDYIERAGCKFRKGRNQPTTSLWTSLGLKKTR